MVKSTFTLMNILEGYVRNYRRLNIHSTNNWSTITAKEINYFAEVGEYLGFFTYMEDKKPNKDYGRSRPMDLSWWKWNSKFSKTHFEDLVLHLERENQVSKDIDTINKLFCNTDIHYKPSYVIGIMNVRNDEHISILKEEVMKRNRIQNSEALMIYQYYDNSAGYHRLVGSYISADCNLYEELKIISALDKTNYWMMCFEDEFEK